MVPPPGSILLAVPILAESTVDKIKRIYSALLNQDKDRPLTPKNFLEPDHQAAITDLLSGHLEAAIRADGEWGNIEERPGFRLHCTGLGTIHQAFQGDADYQLECAPTVQNYSGSLAS